MLGNRDPVVGKEREQFSPFSCTVPNTHQNTHRHRWGWWPGGVQNQSDACVLFVRGREWAFTEQRPQARHVTGWLHFCRDAKLAVFYPSPQNVSLVWQLFQTENYQGSKDSGRDFDLPPNCLENLDRGPVPQIELSPEILMPKSWLSVHWC